MLKNPTYKEIKEMRESARLTQGSAADKVYVTKRAWQRWEQEPGNISSREMPLSTWELFLIKIYFSGIKVDIKYMLHFRKLGLIQ